jgi:hypothetical protein
MTCTFNNIELNPLIIGPNKANMLIINFEGLLRDILNKFNPGKIPNRISKGNNIIPIATIKPKLNILNSHQGFHRQQ